MYYAYSANVLSCLQQYIQPISKMIFLLYSVAQVLHRKRYVTRNLVTQNNHRQENQNEEHNII